MGIVNNRHTCCGNNSANISDKNNNNQDENNDNWNENNNKKKDKFNFYLDRPFLINCDLDEEDKYFIKQIYAINRINLIIKHVREFLNNKNEKREEDQDYLNQVLRKKKSNLSNTKTNSNLSPDLKLKENFFACNHLEQLMKNNLYAKFGRLKEGKDDFHIIKLGDNATLVGKYSSSQKVYYIKIFFDNKDIFKSIEDISQISNYGLYYYYAMGCIYEGYWENNIKNGIGIEKRWDWTTYEGEFKEGKKNGIGMYKWHEDNSIYFGEWLNNNIHGFGVFKNGEKSKYQGEFFMNKRNGYGELIKYKTGSFYFGYWNNNRKKGFGVEFSARNNGNNKIYIGFWNGKYRHGFGAVLNKIRVNQNIFGLWKDNKNIKVFKSITEFKNKIDISGFSNYIPFFDKTFEEYEEIIKLMIDSSEFINTYMT